MLTLQHRQSCCLDEGLRDALPSPAHPLLTSVQLEKLAQFPRGHRRLAAGHLLHADDVVLRLPAQRWNGLSGSQPATATTASSLFHPRTRLEKRNERNSIFVTFSASITHVLGFCSYLVRVFSRTPSFPS